MIVVMIPFYAYFEFIIIDSIKVIFLYNCDIMLNLSLTVPRKHESSDNYSRITV